MNVDHPTLNTIITMNNNSKQDAGRTRWKKHPWVSVISKVDLTRMYIDEGKTQREIANVVGCSLKPIQTAMKNFGIDSRKSIKRANVNLGEFSWSWKGGKSTTKAGYVLVRAEGHPRATKRGFYVFEHIVVMENKLGRYLVDGEVIHHVDGNKKNNSIENLELTSPNEHIEHHRNAKDGRIVGHGAK